MRPDSIKTETKRGIYAFGDILNFGIWARRSSTSTSDFKEFIMFTHRKFVELTDHGYFIKLLADGLMIVKEVKTIRRNGVQTKFLTDMCNLHGELMQKINSMSYPRPDGFRIRIVAGDSYKIKVSRGKKFNEYDYLGYNVNLAFRLLDVHKDKPIVVHESFKDMISEKNSFSSRFNKLPKSKEDLSGVDDEDIDDLWKFDCDEPI